MHFWVGQRANFKRHLLTMHSIFYLVLLTFYQGALYSVLKSNIYVNGIKCLSYINALDYIFFMTKENELKTNELITAWFWSCFRKFIFLPNESDFFLMKTLSPDFYGVSLECLASSVWEREKFCKLYFQSLSKPDHVKLCRSFYAKESLSF